MFPSGFCIFIKMLLLHRNSFCCFECDLCLSILSHCPCHIWNLPAASSCLTFPPFCPDIPFWVGYYIIKFQARHQSCCIQSYFPATIPAKILAFNCRIKLNWLIEMRLELPKCQIEFVLPNRIAKLKCGIELANRFGQFNLAQIKLPNRIAELKCRIELPNPFASP
jgi:hypothetical protein